MYEARLPAPDLPAKTIPAKIARIKMSGKFPVDTRIPPLQIKVLLKSNPRKSRIFVQVRVVCCFPLALDMVRRLAVYVGFLRSRTPSQGISFIYTYVYVYVYIHTYIYIYIYMYVCM